MEAPESIQAAGKLQGWYNTRRCPITRRSGTLETLPDAVLFRLDELRQFDPVLAVEIGVFPELQELLKDPIVRRGFEEEFHPSLFVAHALNIIGDFSTRQPEAR